MRGDEILIHLRLLDHATPRLNALLGVLKNIGNAVRKLRVQAAAEEIPRSVLRRLPRSMHFRMYSDFYLRHRGLREFWIALERIRKNMWRLLPLLFGFLGIMFEFMGIMRLGRQLVDWVTKSMTNFTSVLRDYALELAFFNTSIKPSQIRSYVIESLRLQAALAGLRTVFIKLVPIIAQVIVPAIRRYITLFSSLLLENTRKITYFLYAFFQGLARGMQIISSIIKRLPIGLIENLGHLFGIFAALGVIIAPLAMGFMLLINIVNLLMASIDAIGSSALFVIGTLYKTGIVFSRLAKAFLELRNGTQAFAASLHGIFSGFSLIDILSIIGAIAAIIFAIIELMRFFSKPRFPEAASLKPYTSEGFLAIDINVKSSEEFDTKVETMVTRNIEIASVTR